MIYITRREHFNAAHRVFDEKLTDLENFEKYGACSNPNWHGHNYELFVTVKGQVSASEGYVMDLKKLSKLIREYVIRKMDHKNINLEVDFMKGIQPSAENIAKAIFHELKNPIGQYGVTLHRVKLQETENNFVEYFGE